MGTNGAMTICPARDNTWGVSPHTELGGRRWLGGVIGTVQRAQPSWAVTRAVPQLQSCFGRSELTYLRCRVPVVLQFVRVLSLSVICGPQRLASGIIASIGYGKVMGHVNTPWFTLQDLSLQRLHALTTATCHVPLT